MDRNQKILELFPKNWSWEERYKKIIALGKELEPFDKNRKQDKFLIKSCQSRLWLFAELNSQGNVIFTGDSDALITKGILALFILFYSERAPQEILQADPSFLKELELAQYLSLKRANGLPALIQQIQNYAQAFLILNSKKT